MRTAPLPDVFLESARLMRAPVRLHRGAYVDYGLSRNALVTMDIDSGAVIRVIAGTGRDWSDVIDLLHSASRIASGLLVQGWDIALTPRAPVLLEVNWFGDLDLPQYAYERGWLDERFQALLEERSTAHLLAAPNKPCHLNPAAGRRGTSNNHWRY